MPESIPHTDHANPSYTPDHHEESKSRTVMSEEKPSTQGAQFRADMHSGTKTELSTEDLEPSADMEFPDGGRGWLVAFGEFCMICATFGLVNSWVFQSHYQTVILPTTNPSAIAWIGSIQYSFILLPGLISGRLFDLGYLRWQRIPASLAVIVSTFLVAECKQFWQFLICQGIVTGLGAGFCFGPCVPTLSHWFKKKRSTALGLVATGTAVGGTIVPIAVRNLIPVVGFKWTMRILGFILLLQLSTNILLSKRRLPVVHVSGGLFNLRAFKSAPYTLYVVASCLAYLGLYTQLTYIDVFGVLNGISPEYSFYLVAIANAGSLVGRLGSGPICDRFGNLNILIPSNVLTAVTTFVWPYCTSVTSLTIIAAAYGVALGAFAALVAAPVASLGDTGDVGRRTGMLFTFCAIASLIGPPISGAIFSRFGRFLEVGIYAGCMILGSSIFMFTARWFALGRRLRGKF